MVVTTVVEFWDVGKTASAMLPMTTRDICSHLLADWVPSLPAAVSSSFIGWPPFLLGVANFNGNKILALREDAGRTERQWKSVLSWMLGVAGARHVLRQHRYRWIGPLSAFYPGVAQFIDPTHWHLSFPPCTITVRRRRRSRSRLRPDYLALTSTARADGHGWAVVEAKGTSASLNNATKCRDDWASQVRSVVIRFNGARVPVARHLVVATRVNPNASHPRARRIQVRAWNRRDESERSRLPSEATVDIAAAHLFGLFRGLGLRNNAVAMAMSVQARTEAREGGVSESTRAAVRSSSERAEAELHERGRFTPQSDGRTVVVISVVTELGTIEVKIADQVISLARRLSLSQEPGSAVEALQEADSQLDDWEASRVAATRDRDTVVLPFGVEVRLPEEFEPR